MEPQTVVNEYCTCGIWVAPYDDDKIVVSNRRCHLRCYKHKLAAAMRAILPQQLYPF